jgi:phage terminase small subunit
MDTAPPAAKKVRTRTPRLTQQQIKFLDQYAVSRNGTDAAMSVGYTKSSAPQMAQRTLKNPAAIEYLRTLTSESRAIAAYDLATAMTESLEVIAFAKDKGNAMAYFKAVEHRAKLSGLLIDRIQVEKVDIRGAILEAEARLVELQTPQYIESDQQNNTENSVSVEKTTGCELTQSPLSDARETTPVGEG